MSLILDTEHEQKPDPLYHYSFNIDDEELKSLGINDEQIQSYKSLLLTTLADYIAKELRDNWLIDEDDNKFIILYGEDTSENNRVKLYVGEADVPEDTLYLGKDGIEMFSRDVGLIENHKVQLDVLTEHMQDLIKLLIEVDNENIDPELKELKKVETILSYYDEEELKYKKARSIKFN